MISVWNITKFIPHTWRSEKLVIFQIHFPLKIKDNINKNFRGASSEKKKNMLWSSSKRELGDAHVSGGSTIYYNRFRGHNEVTMI